MSSVRLLEMEDFKLLIDAYQQSRSAYFRLGGFGTTAAKNKILIYLENDLTIFINNQNDFELKTTDSATTAVATAAAATAATVTTTPPNLFDKLLAYMEDAYQANTQEKSNIHFLLENIFQRLIDSLAERLINNDSKVHVTANRFLNMTFREHRISGNSFSFAKLISAYKKIAAAYTDNPDKDFHTRRGELAESLYRYICRYVRTAYVAVAGSVSCFAISTVVMGIAHLVERNVDTSKRTFLFTQPFIPPIEKGSFSQQLFQILSKELILDNNKINSFVDTYAQIISEHESYRRMSTQSKESELSRIMADMAGMISTWINKSGRVDLIAALNEVITRKNDEPHDSYTCELARMGTNTDTARPGK